MQIKTESITKINECKNDMHDLAITNLITQDQTKVFDEFSREKM